ncbi:MAG: copper chaperone PCu(A)C [Actinomycetota bacterium]
MKSRITTLSLLAVTVLALAGCGGDDEAAESLTSEAPAVDATNGDVDSGVDISSVWARTSPMMTSNGAVYMTIGSVEGDELLSASVDASIAGSAEIHESMESDMSGDMSGQMTMQEVDSIVIPAGDTVQLMPGGYHVMLLDLAGPLELGQMFEVTLTFANAGEIVVMAEVRDDAP